MTVREWKPGDVAMVPGVGRAVATYDGKWATQTLEVAPHVSLQGGFISARPLVVLDPEDREQVHRLADLLCASTFGLNADDMVMAEVLREFANPTPLTPDEPTGLGAVVENQWGTRYVCDFVGRWYGPSNATGPDSDVYGYWDYSHTQAIRVLSEGVTS